MNRWLCAAALLASLMNLQGCDGGPANEDIPTTCDMPSITECAEKQAVDEDAAPEEQCKSMELTLMCYNNCCDAEFSMGEGNATAMQGMTGTMTGKEMQEISYAGIEALNAMIAMFGGDKCDIAKPKCMK